MPKTKNITSRSLVRGWLAGAAVLILCQFGLTQDDVAMRAMKDAGAYNVAQDETSCVVFGMPREAIAAGAIHKVLPLVDISVHVLRYVNDK